MKADVVTLSNLAQGAAAEMFEHALGQVMENIKDPNADPSKKRRITLTVEFQPYGDRSGAETTIACVAKVTPVNAVRSSLFVAMEEGEYKAFTHDTRQEDLFAEKEPEQTAKVTRIGQAK
jgi:hypothetical protein